MAFKITAQEKALILRRRKVRAKGYPDAYKKRQIKDALDVVDDVRRLITKRSWILQATPEGRAYLENLDGYKLYFSSLVAKDKKLGRMWSH